MSQRYSIAQNTEGAWVVRAEGQDLLVCVRESDALRAATEADQPSEPTCLTAKLIDPDGHGSVGVSGEVGRK